jgi:hypothetical protein
MYNNTDPTQQRYLNHIKSGNNNDLLNLSIASDLQWKIFFSTLSITLNITIQVNHISQSSHITTTINSCLFHNLTKILNIRSSISNTNIYEPWINPPVLNTEPKVKIKYMLYSLVFTSISYQYYIDVVIILYQYRTDIVSISY